MSQLEEKPSVLLQTFGENLLDQMEAECADGDADISRGIVHAVYMIVMAASDTARALESQEERNESA